MNIRALLSFIIALIIFAFASYGCKDDPVSSSDCPADQRTGAVCNDGTTSSATGSGACSGHGGVKNWICN